MFPEDELNIPSTLQQIELPLLRDKEIGLYIKRDDQIHSEISGNKWRKLKYNIAEAKKQGKTSILTFGGAFSNHIAATAKAGHMFGLDTIGIIRGEEPKELNSTLKLAMKNGMRLKFVSRKEYSKKDDYNSVSELVSHENTFVVPEGGANILGAKGCEDIINEIESDFDVVCCACGTGTTLAGIVNTIHPTQKAIGVSVLKGEDTLTNGVKELVGDKENWEISFDYHFGGYAKHDPKLVDFILDFKKETGIQLDPIYTGKMMFGLLDLIKQGEFQRGSKVIAVHTGGLQGISGYNARYGTSIELA